MSIRSSAEGRCAIFCTAIQLPAETLGRRGQRHVLVHVGPNKANTLQAHNIVMTAQ